MISISLRQEIETALKTQLVALVPLSAANNAHIYRLQCANGRVLVAKVAEKGLALEAWMLTYLKEKSTLPVPAVAYAQDHIMVMDYIESHHTLDAAVQRDAAQHLAHLHSIQSTTYGLERDTLIGALHQPNPQMTDWPAFFAEHRLLYMGKEALKEGKIESKTMQMIEKLAGKIRSFLSSDSPPCLIHGDVWSGNILAGRGKIAAFFDPAIYYADPEVELAFIRLLNTFDDGFFYRYNEIKPLRPGFSERAKIYNIYPLLVHARLFGTSYARKAHRLLESFF